MKSTRLSYIPRDLTNYALDFSWRGIERHMGPSNVYTPLFFRLDRITTTSLVSINAGLLSWAACRLEAYTDEAYHARGLAEAAFAYQIDWRYVNSDADTRAPTPPSMAKSILQELSFLLWRSMDPEKYWENYYGPIAETFHLAHAVRYIIPKAHQADLSRWLNKIINRAHETSATPNMEFADRDAFDDINAWQQFIADFRGDALPPDFLDPELNYNSQLRSRLVKDFIEGVDWKYNSYLRSPEQMLQLGFEGLPYKLDKKES